ncbi:hypothetical protein BG015_006539 [Linnemannia schmuckeri]|uniref:Protein Lines C-terminal domain-containing protein n=1 Tax=Linnemannia schmuckeri TaxID=64567 RepID=A0A9P5RZM4_9FUNG|nr:hypothetical protein BG015_006539 [Linnemannia schmuckeri]
MNAINSSEDVIAQLAVLSDEQLLKDTQLHLVLLQQPDTLICLLELEDLYVQFSAYRLAKAILLNRNIYTFDKISTALLQSQNLYSNRRQQVIQTLVKKLIHLDNRDCSGTGRAILELFHGLLKDHRHLVRNADHHGTIDYDDHHNGDDSQPTSSLSSSAEERKAKAISRHVAVTIVQELASSGFWEARILDRILSVRGMQYAALVLFVDLEKARMFVAVDTVPGVSDEFRDSVMVCHYNLIRYMDKWMVNGNIGSLPLKKHLELICISMKPSPPPLPHQHSSGQQLHQPEKSVDRETYLKRRPLEILMAQSPIVQDVLYAFQELDPDLDDFSSSRTTFILPDNCSVHDYTSAGTSSTTATNVLQIKAFLSNPEAIRQLGRICLTAALSILDTLTSAFTSTDNDNAIVDYYGQITEPTSKYLIPFLEAWIGDRTLPLLLTVYGEDDAGVSWLLKTISLIYRRILDLSRTSPPPQVSQQQHELDKIRSVLENHIHPLEALFSFLETIGFDYQTLLDLLLTLDDPHESGGMLAAVMAILRSFTEDSSDQERVLRRWREEILDDQQLHLCQLEQRTSNSESEPDVDDDKSHQLRTRFRLLDNVHHCLDQLSHQIQRLHKNSLFPYNPKPLLHVLQHTQDILFTVLTDS